MRALIVTPSERGSRSGNRITALRWAKRLRELHWRVTVDESYREGEWDLVFALHARASADAALRAKAPVIVALTGTDAYVDLPSGSHEAQRALERAARIVALQPRAIDQLPDELKPRAVTIFQSVPPIAPRTKFERVFKICVLGHLRDVKDPLRVAEAVRLLPPSSRVEVVHLGGAHTEAWAQRAREESERNPRWKWLGARSRAEALDTLARSHLLVLSSRSEGGANVVSEALAAGVPVLSSRIEGSIGVLGDHYPGYFPVGDAAALAKLIERAEREPAFYESLRQAGAARAEWVSVEREREAFRALTGEVVRFSRTVGTVGDPLAELRADVLDGLSADPPRLSCRYFYDPEGSRLFEEICGLDEYYVTRAEHAILSANAHAIAAESPAGAAVIELGSGSAQKTRLVLDALLARAPELTYVPVDVSAAALDESAWRLLADEPRLRVEAIHGDWTDALQRIGAGPSLTLWLGSNIGNLDRAAAAAFLRRIGERMRPDDRLLVGVDLRKDRATLERAYDDARGVTAAFNKNLLHRINRELGADFPVDDFAHRAVWDEPGGKIDMYLVPARDLEVRIFERRFKFSAGRAIHTESSYKYSPAEIDALIGAANLRERARYTDGRFADLLLERRA
jgi:dimethylhistidine N-methyltransferase